MQCYFPSFLLSFLPSFLPYSGSGRQVHRIVAKRGGVVESQGMMREEVRQEEDCL